MERLKHYIFVRHGHNWMLLFRFGLVGASGVFVNLLVAIIVQEDRSGREQRLPGPAVH